MTNRIFNFSAGPCTLPLPALEKAQHEFLDYQCSGMSIIEQSHRGKQYDEIHNTAIANLKFLLDIPDDFSVLMLHGGATQNFVMIPMNFAKEGKSLDYVLTGSWSKKAAAEGKRYNGYKAIWSNEEKPKSCMPVASEIVPSENAAYVHICSNETIGGIELQEFPDCGDIPVIIDMSSHIMSRPLPFDKIDMIYAGAQKNLGPAGMGIVIIRNSLIAQANTDISNFMSYKTHADSNSLYNTPPVFAIYMMNNVLEWVKANGGVLGMQKLATQRSAFLYDAVDASDGWYSCPVEKSCRSKMNVVWRLPTEELEKKFISEAAAAGFSGLKGHRSVGGCRASMYNAMPVEGAEKLAQFMIDFKNNN
ncbi:MAG: 3-phosphoserine/phosphohydroxythreonine transaminase [Deltaproteobacteria bacterium]|nr:3-phosphoserine/phosphohydroxythreonine transaminase [Deltaproteobacteria bacterium]MBN2674776.1 3-phosphoserine/phosphohydroxythreonine transaminase [Deltaproteobacteria bacterium]